MEKEKFVSDINRGILDPQATYRYFIEKGGKLDFQTFHMIFQQSQQQVYEYFLKKFNITSLIDKQGNTIRVWI